MEEYRKEYAVTVLCDALGVSVSGYYAWKRWPMSEHGRADDMLADQIQEVYHSCRQVYGSPRIHAELQAQGIKLRFRDSTNVGESQSAATRFAIEHDLV